MEKQKCDRHEYKLRIGDDLFGKEITFPDYPDLKIAYINSENNLCPSNYSDAMCIWEGDLVITLKVNNKLITLNDHDSKNNMVHRIGEYELQGVKPIVEDKSRDKTYIIVSIGKCKTVYMTHKLGDHFTLELAENPSTGYIWTVKTSPGLLVSKETHTLKDCPEGFTGCPVTKVYELIGTEKGKQTLDATHGRPWDSTTQHTFHYEYEII